MASRKFTDLTAVQQQRFLLLWLSSLLLLILPISSWVVTPPSSKRDWVELSYVVVDCFESPIIINNNNDNESMTISSWLSRWEQWRWDTVGREATRQAVYKRYVRTSMRMRGTKYSILLARDAGHVIGMAEVGMTTTTTTSTTTEDDTSIVSDTASSSSSLLQQQQQKIRCATVGVLGVLPGYQQRGVGRDLMKKCEELVSTVWQEDEICVDVETTNQPAIQFFDKLGYANATETNQLSSEQECTTENEAATVNVLIRGANGKTELRPHYRLRKTLVVPTNKTMAPPSDRVVAVVSNDDIDIDSDTDTDDDGTRNEYND